MKLLNLIDCCCVFLFVRFFYPITKNPIPGGESCKSVIIPLLSYNGLKGYCALHAVKTLRGKKKSNILLSTEESCEEIKGRKRTWTDVDSAPASIMS